VCVCVYFFWGCALCVCLFFFPSFYFFIFGVCVCVSLSLSFLVLSFWFCVCVCVCVCLFALFVCVYCSTPTFSLVEKKYFVEFSMVEKEVCCRIFICLGCVCVSTCCSLFVRLALFVDTCVCFIGGLCLALVGWFVRSFLPYVPYSFPLVTIFDCWFYSTT
jgi:hypothetical protein